MGFDAERAQAMGVLRYYDEDRNGTLELNEFARLLTELARFVAEQRMSA